MTQEEANALALETFFYLTKEFRGEKGICYFAMIDGRYGRKTMIKSHHSTQKDYPGFCFGIYAYARHFEIIRKQWGFQLKKTKKIIIWYREKSPIGERFRRQLVKLFKAERRRIFEYEQNSH